MKESAIGSTSSSSALADQPPVAPRRADTGEARCLVVMYHYVHDREPLAEPGCPGPHRGVRGLTQAGFRAQLDLLCGALEPTDWPSLFAWRNGRGSIPHRAFLLTFDDGLADHAETVLPILEERGLRGVFFVPGAVLTTYRMLSAHALHLLLSRMSESELMSELRQYLVEHGAQGKWLAELDAILIGATKSNFVAPAAQAIYHYESPIRARLKHLLNMAMPIELRVAAVNTLFERHVGSSARWARHWYLSWDDLIRLQSSGHTIGGHGFSHEAYSRLTPAQCRRDLDRVYGVLREGLGSDLRPFSFPYGSVAGDLGGICQEAGFPHAFGTEPRWLCRNDDQFCLPRIDAIDVEAALHEEVACAKA